MIRKMLQFIFIHAPARGLRKIKEIITKICIGIYSYIKGRKGDNHPKKNDDITQPLVDNKELEVVENNTIIVDPVGYGVGFLIRANAGIERIDRKVDQLQETVDRLEGSSNQINNKLDILLNKNFQEYLNSKNDNQDAKVTR